MSTQYKSVADVPTDVLCQRLDELSDAATTADMSEFYMRIPAEVDHDADLVLSESARRLAKLTEMVKKLIDARGLQPVDNAIVADLDDVIDDLAEMIG